MRKAKKDRHGLRGVPPPLTFDLNELPDNALLSQVEVAAAKRAAKISVEKKRLAEQDAPLVWVYIDGGRPRCTAAR